MINISKEKKYSVFNVEDIFDLFSGALISSDKLRTGDIPRITATSNNNGIAMFTNEVNDNNFRLFENFISISFLGDVFYQKNKVSLDMKIHGIKPKEIELNKYIAHYLIPLIKNFSKKYSYGNQLSMRLLKRQKIMLPIKKDNSPDWLFMESKGKELYKKSSDNLSKYIQKKYNHLAEELEGLEPQTLNSRTWLPFDIENLFTNIQRGKRLTKANQMKGDIPYISSTSLNNGVDGYIGNKNDVRKSGQDITIANSGSVGSSFYHPYNYIASDHVHSLSDKKYNKYHYLFITTLLDKVHIIV